MRTIVVSERYQNYQNGLRSISWRTMLGLIVWRPFHRSPWVLLSRIQKGLKKGSVKINFTILYNCGPPGRAFFPCLLRSKETWWRNHLCLSWLVYTTIHNSWPAVLWTLGRVFRPASEKIKSDPPILIPYFWLYRSIFLQTLDAIQLHMKQQNW